jgi:hypothetical protein
MQTITIEISQKLTRKDVESILQQWSAGQGASITPQGRLARKYKTKGTSMHWHVTGVKAGMGTVEVTYDHEMGKLEVSVHDNRRGYWAHGAYRELGKILSRRIRRAQT